MDGRGIALCFEFYPLKIIEKTVKRKPAMSNIKKIFGV